MVKNKGQSSVVSLFFSLTTRRRKEKRRARRRRKRRRKRQRRTRRRVNCARRIGVVSPRNRTKGNPFASSRFIAKTFFAFALRTLTRNAKRRRKRRRRRRKTNARDGYFLGFVLDRGCRGSFQSLSSGHDDVKFGRRRDIVMLTTREYVSALLLFL